MAIYTVVLRDDLATFLEHYQLLLEDFAGIPAGSVNSNYWVVVRPHRALAASSTSSSDPLRAHSDAVNPLSSATGDQSQPEGKGGSVRYFLRVYEEQGPEGAEAEATLLAALARHGVPTPGPVADAAGRAIGTLAGKPAALFPWRQGGSRCQASVSQRDVTQVGRGLAQLHAAGPTLGVSRGAGRFGRAALEARLEIIAQAPQAELRAAGAWIAARLPEVAAARNASLPGGVVHGDLFRDNVLFDSAGELVALLDFESAFDGPFAFDLAVCILAWTYGDDFDPALIRAMVDAYRSVRELAPAERAALFDEIRFGALRFSTTRITDFAMRPGGGVMKDYRRFLRRFERVEAMGRSGLERMAFA